MIKWLKKLFKRINVWVNEDVELNKRLYLDIHKTMMILDTNQSDKLKRIMDKLDIQELEITDEDPIEVFQAAIKSYSKPNEFIERIAFEKGAQWQAKQLKNKSL